MHFFPPSYNVSVNKSINEKKTSLDGRPSRSVQKKKVWIAFPGFYLFEVVLPYFVTERSWQQCQI